MDYEDSIREAAHRADTAARKTMAAYQDRTFEEEVPLTGALVMALREGLTGVIEGLKWSGHVLKSTGRTEEWEYGADILFHVRFKTPKLEYSKGVLVQAKRAEPRHRLPPVEHKELISQCNRMLRVTPAAFVFDYTKQEMRCGSALAVSGSTNRNLYDQCVWTSYRFFLELFRCFIGDFAISSAHTEDLPVPTVMRIDALG